MLEFWVRAVLIGAGATLVMDFWAVLQNRLFGISSLDYRLVGRWIGHWSEGRFVHAGIGKAAPVAGEAALGWFAHYLIGIVFAALLLMLWGLDWARQPTVLPALIVGIGSIVAPFFLMQPAFGLGIAAANTPAPWTARWRSLVAHTSFAVGLYLAASLTAPLRF